MPPFTPLYIPYQCIGEVPVLLFFLTLMLSSATWLLFSSSAKGRGEILLRLQGRTHRRKKGRSKMSIIQEEAKGQSRREGTQLYIQG